MLSKTSLRLAWRLRRQALANRVVHGLWRHMQQAGIITVRTTAGRRFAAFGPGSLIAFPTGTIYGERWIEIGDRTMIAELASICAGMMPGHDLGTDPILRIGNGCVIGRGSHIVAHSSIDIGDDVYTGPYVYITDQNHSYADPDLPIGRQWPVNAPVRIGAGTWLGTGVIVLPGSVIGQNVVVAAGSVVRGEIGDHCVVAGVPAKVVKYFSREDGWSRRPGREDGRSRRTGREPVAEPVLPDREPVAEPVLPDRLPTIPLADGAPIATVLSEPIVAGQIPPETPAL